MKKVGEILRKEREKRGLTLQEIGMALKINPKMLAGIEEGDLDSLPARTFLRGFVRSYAQYLRIDVDHILKLFNEETAPAVAPMNLDTPVANPVQPAEPKPTAAPSIGPTFDIKKYVYPIISILILSVLIIVAAVTLEKYQKETQVKPYTTGHPIQEDATKPEGTADSTETTSTQTSSAEATIAEKTDTKVEADSNSSTTTTSAPTARGVLFLATTSTVPASTTTLKPVDTATTTTVKPKPTTTTVATTTTTVKPTTTTTSTTTTQKPKPTTTTAAPTTTTTSTTQKPKPTTTTTSNSTTTTTVKAAAVADPTVTTSSTTTTVKVNQNEIILEAYDKVVVKFSADEKTWQQVELNADQVHTLRSKGLIYLDISNGGAVNLIVNGKERGVPGRIGESFKTKVP